jgi:hypothetical protein
VNSADINMSGQVTLLCADLHSFGYMLKSGIAESYGSSIFSFLGTSILILIVAALIYIPNNGV